MRDRRYKKLTVRAFAVGTGLSVIVGTFAAPLTTMAAAKDMEKPVVLRVCNWEEYIDEGGWEDDELIDLPSEDIFGENSLVSDFEEWYYETYGVPVKVEYSTFGTNEELYSQLNLGNEYDLVASITLYRLISSTEVLEYLSEPLMRMRSLPFFSCTVSLEEPKFRFFTKSVRIWPTAKSSPASSRDSTPSSGRRIAARRSHR